MKELTEDLVEKVFFDCYWPNKEWMNGGFEEENAPCFALLDIPLPEGIDAIAFHPDKLIKNLKTIKLLINQVKNISEGKEINFYELNIKSNKKKWTNRILSITELYALGMAACQITLDKSEEKSYIRRVMPNDELETYTAYKDNGEIKILKRINKIGSIKTE